MFENPRGFRCHGSKCVIIRFGIFLLRLRVFAYCLFVTLAFLFFSLLLLALFTLLVLALFAFLLLALFVA